MNQALTVFDGLRRRDTTGRDKPDLRRFGLSTDFKLIEHPELWRLGDKMEEMPPMRNCANAARAADGKLACLDIEHLPIDPWHVADPPPVERYADRQQAEQNRQILRGIIEAMHDGNPGLSVGYFNLMPLYHWAALEDPAMPADHPRYVAWLEQNASMRRSINLETNEIGPRGLADVVNAVFPQCYAHHDDLELWEAQTRKQIDEALKYEKPIYPFLAPFYLEGRLPTGQLPPIDGRMMRHQLDVMHDCEIDGVVLFGHLNMHAEWWATVIDWLTGQ